MSTPTPTPTPDSVRLPRLVVATLGLAAALVPGYAGSERSAPLPVLPISFAVAEVDGRPVVDDAWLETRLEWTNKVFGTRRIAFAAVASRALGQEHARLETRADRDALGPEVRGQVINCFVVESLRDVDDPSQMRRGVHWRPRGGPAGRHYVILSSIAGPTVLAHELGHFFGNPRHSEVPGNIMSYAHGQGIPVFDDRQARTVMAFARRFLATGELVPASQLLAPPEPASAEPLPR